MLLSLIHNANHLPLPAIAWKPYSCRSCQRPPFSLPSPVDFKVLKIGYQKLFSQVCLLHVDTKDGRSSASCVNWMKVDTQDCKRTSKSVKQSWVRQDIGLRCQQYIEPIPREGHSIILYILGRCCQSHIHLNKFNVFITLVSLFQREIFDNHRLWCLEIQTWTILDYQLFHPLG